MKHRLAWPAAAAIGVMAAYWLLVGVVGGWYELKGWNTRKYHHGDIHRQLPLEIILSIVLAVFAAGLTWFIQYYGQGSTLNDTDDDDDDEPAQEEVE